LSCNGCNIRKKDFKIRNAFDVLYYGTATALAAISLTVFNFFSIKAKEVEQKLDDQSETRAKDLKK
jgi:hypothetical protein